MITFTGGIQSQMSGSERMVSRNFFVFPIENLSGLRVLNEKLWGAGILFADKKLIRVQMVMPSQAFDFELPEHSESTQSYIGLAESAAGVIAKALDLSDASYRREVPYGFEFGTAIPFEGVLLTEHAYPNAVPVEV